MKSNRVSCPLFLFVLVAMFFAFADTRAAAQNVYETEDGKKFQVSLSQEEEWVFVGEPLRLKLTIRNLAETALVFLDKPLSGPAGGFSVKILQPNGSPPTLNRFATVAPKGEAMIEVQPGSAYWKHLFIPADATFQSDGPHIVTVEKIVFFKQTDSVEAPIRIAATIKLDVQSRNTDRFGEIIEKLEKDLLHGDHTAASRAGTRLALVHDARVATIFRRFLEYCATQVNAEGTLPKPLADNIHTVTFAFVSNERFRSLSPAETDVSLSLMKNSPSVEIRASFARRLGENTSLHNVSLLLDLRDDSSPTVRMLVALGLGYSSHPEAEQALFEMTTDPDSKVRATATECLAKHKAANRR